ncbi:tyrosine-type recombinase/integrase [Micromonospora sp. NPDC049679]|uniref:tyrosine-type recombinase/integrase n=1 Tax=Micromonospora sp. NPDC049679 TaxID=3155920 RepID=UPI0033C3CA7F
MTSRTEVTWGTGAQSGMGIETTQHRAASSPAQTPVVTVSRRQRPLIGMSGRLAAPCHGQSAQALGSVSAQAVSELPGGPVLATPKSHQRRELLVPAFVVTLLGEHLATLPDDPDGFAFPGRQKHTQHRQQSYHGFRRRFQLAVTAAGLSDITPHDLRATHASWVADSHGVMVAARRLGHANASVTTRHYARAIDQRDAEVAKHLDKLGGAKPSGTQRARKSRMAGK